MEPTVQASLLNLESSFTTIYTLSLQRPISASHKGFYHFLKKQQKINLVAE